MSKFSENQIKKEAKAKKVALCAIGRLENQYIREYVMHYQNLGFDKIFLYDNNHDGEEYFQSVIGDFINQGFVELTDFRGKEAAQMEAYNDCYTKHGAEYDWIAFFDIDEFLHLKGEKDIHLYLNKLDKFECVLVNWMIMTDNGQVYNTRRPLEERFTEPMDYDKKGGYSFPENNHVKSIVRGGLDVKFNNPHIPSTPVKCCNANGERVDQSPWTPYKFDKAYLKHFQYKTIEEWLTNKMKRGTADRTFDSFKNDTSVDNFFRVNEKTDVKMDVINNQRRQLVIVSMTTIPKRMKRLTDNLPFLLNQSYRYDKLIINVDDNLSEDDYKWYNDLKKLDDRIEINIAEAKWRSCNKLLPTLKKYPHDIIITCDDDVAYDRDTFLSLVQEHMKHPDCIIAHEVNPILLNNNYITYVNGYDVKLMQVEWGKYLSNCALFPPYSFDKDLFDYDKMMECTKGLHDELWMWIQSTIHGVQCVGLNYVRSFADDMLEPYKEGEYCLSSYNNTEAQIDAYMQIINRMYGKKLLEEIGKKPVVFTITKDNIYAFYFLIPYIRGMYPNAAIQMSGLTASWRNHLLTFLNGKQPTI